MMGNPKPKLENLKPFQPKGDRPLGKVIGTRYPEEVEAVLRGLGDDMHDYIRAAVLKQLQEDKKV